MIKSSYLLKFYRRINIPCLFETLEMRFKPLSKKKKKIFNNSINQLISFSQTLCDFKYICYKLLQNEKITSEM